MVNFNKHFNNNKVNIITYHYIRDKDNNKIFNFFNYLDLKKFKNQILYFKKKSSIINENQFIDILYSKKLPRKPCVLLTFDDGYKDHFTNVMPVLLDQKIKGLFYITTDAFEEKILDVNKIQLIVNFNKDTNKLISEINRLLKKFEHPLIDEKTIAHLDLKKFKWDTYEKKICKFFLQYEIKSYCRSKIVDILFNKILNISKKNFIKKMYLNINDLKSMKNNDMSFGIHGKSHSHWDKISLSKVELEIKNSITFFKKNNIYNDNISCCYPYGAYNKNVIKILKKNRIKYAVTVIQDSLNKNNIHNKYEIPRLPCNFF